VKVLDAHIGYENDFISVMTFDEEHHGLGIVQLPPPAKRNSGTDSLNLLHAGDTQTWSVRPHPVGCS
jgi:hypothetical protein